MIIEYIVFILIYLSLKNSIFFFQDVKDKFGKEFGIKESSPYKGLIREIKAKPKSTKPKAESLTMKMRDIVEEILKETGNPVSILFDRMQTHLQS